MIFFSHCDCNIPCKELWGPCPLPVHNSDFFNYGRLLGTRESRAHEKIQLLTGILGPLCSSDPPTIEEEEDWQHMERPTWGETEVLGPKSRPSPQPTAGSSMLVTWVSPDRSTSLSRDLNRCRECCRAQTGSPCQVLARLQTCKQMNDCCYFGVVCYTVTDNWEGS